MVNNPVAKVGLALISSTGSGNSIVSNVSKAASGSLGSISAKSATNVNVSDKIKTAVKSTVSTISKYGDDIVKSGDDTLKAAGKIAAKIIGKDGDDALKATGKIFQKNLDEVKKLRKQLNQELGVG